MREIEPLAAANIEKCTTDFAHSGCKRLGNRAIATMRKESASCSKSVGRITRGDGCGDAAANEQIKVALASAVK
jgi:hypothetical protein